MDEEDPECLGEGDGREEGSSVLGTGVLSDEHRSERGEHADGEAVEDPSDEYRLQGKDLDVSFLFLFKLMPMAFDIGLFGLPLLTPLRHPQES